MKILMLGLFDANVNDACKVHFSEIANALNEIVDQVDILIPNFDKTNIFNESINILSCNIRYSTNLYSVIIKSFSQLFYYAKHISEKHDVVYIRWRFLPALFLRAINFIKGVKPLIVTEHNGWVELESHIQYNSRIVSYIGKWLQVLDARSSDLVITVTEGIKNKLTLSGIKSDKIKVVDNGTNTNHFYPLNNRLKLKQELIDSNDLILGFLGNISKWQGLDELLKSFNKLAQKQSNFKLLIIGDGNFRKQLEANIKESSFSSRIILIPGIDYKEVNKWMNIMDIAFCPKSKLLNEIGYSPLKIRDYAAAGIPIISTDVNGIKELEKYGWLITYNPDDSEDMILKIHSLVLNKKLRNQMGIKGRKFAEQNFSWKNIAQRIVRILRKEVS